MLDVNKYIDDCFVILSELRICRQKLFIFCIPKQISINVLVAQKLENSLTDLDDMRWCIVGWCIPIDRADNIC